VSQDVGKGENGGSWLEKEKNVSDLGGDLSQKEEREKKRN